jgi:hypothetical protein
MNEKALNVESPQALNVQGFYAKSLDGERQAAPSIDFIGNTETAENRRKSR